MSIATFAGILAQTQAADSRCISCAAAAPLAPTARPSSRMRRQPYVPRPSATRRSVAVDNVFDRRLAHGLDRVDIGLRRPPFTNRVGGDHVTMNID